MALPGPKIFSWGCTWKAARFRFVGLCFWSTRLTGAKISFPSFLPRSGYLKCLVYFSSTHSIGTNRVIDEAGSKAPFKGDRSDLHFWGCSMCADHGSLGFCDAVICQRLIGMCSRSPCSGKHASHSARMRSHPQSLQHGYIWSSALELCGSKNGHDL